MVATPDSFQKILIIQTAFIGDVILATALIEKLKAHYPTAQIDFLLRKGNESLLEAHPKLNKCWIWDKKKGKLKNLWQLIRQIRQEQYSLVVNVHRHASSGILTALSGAKIKTGFRKNPFSWAFDRRKEHAFGDGTHEVERNQLLIAEWTDNQAVTPKIYPKEADFELVQPYKKKPYICIAPASVWFTKQYPKEKWVELCNQIPHQYQVYLLGAPSDQELCEEIKASSQHQEITVLAGKISLLASAALMKEASLNYVNDSAPMHLASAMNARTCAVYCSTVPEFGYGPLSDIKHIIQISEPINCRPCGSHGHATCPKGHFDCAMKIKVEDLIKPLSD